MKAFAQRKRNRLQGYCYSQNGAYFVTICAKDRLKLFGTFVGATDPGRPYVELTELGKCINETIVHTNRKDVTIEKYVIMPNHLHIIIVLCAETGDRGRAPLQVVVRNIKSFPTKQIGYSPWQKSFHDHIIRNEKEYQKIWQYIDTNQQNWEKDCFYTE